MSTTFGDQSSEEKHQVRQSVGNWTSDEDDKLREAVAKYGGKNWKKIAENLQGRRTDVQCLHRWKKVLRPGLVKGSWTPEEDAVLREAVEECGIEGVRWSAVAAQLRGRIGKQCRERWMNHLDPSIKSGKWEEREDWTLFSEQQKMGNKWREISLVLGGRTENSVKNRWNSRAHFKLRAQWLASPASWPACANDTDAIKRPTPTCVTESVKLAAPKPAAPVLRKLAANRRKSSPTSKTPKRSKKGSAAAGSAASGLAVAGSSLALGRLLVPPSPSLGDEFFPAWSRYHALLQAVLVANTLGDHFGEVPEDAMQEVGSSNKKRTRGKRWQFGATGSFRALAAASTSQREQLVDEGVLESSHSDSALSSAGKKRGRPTLTTTPMASPTVSEGSEGEDICTSPSSILESEVAFSRPTSRNIAKSDPSAVAVDLLSVCDFSPIEIAPPPLVTVQPSSPSAIPNPGNLGHLAPSISPAGMKEHCRKGRGEAPLKRMKLE